MYNRYIRNEYGEHRRIPQPDRDDPQPRYRPHGPEPPPPPPVPPPPIPPPPPPGPCPPVERPPLDLRFFDRLLDRLHLGDLDSGDLLLLLILFLLFRQDADEEVLIALGLLLIL